MFNGQAYLPLNLKAEVSPVARQLGTDFSPTLPTSAKGPVTLLSLCPLGVDGVVDVSHEFRRGHQPPIAAVSDLLRMRAEFSRQRAMKPTI
jgi:hypothetical protein